MDHLIVWDGITLALVAIALAVALVLVLGMCAARTLNALRHFPKDIRDELQARRKKKLSAKKVN
jgi:hypothetical protein